MLPFRSAVPAQERVKKSANWLKRSKSGPQRRPRGGGDPYKSLFQLDKWIPAFAGMTLRSLAEVCNFDFFTRSKAGMLYIWSPKFNGCSARPQIRAGHSRLMAGIRRPVRQAAASRMVEFCRLQERLGSTQG